MTVSRSKTIDVPIEGMDCAECTRHVKHAIEQVSGVDAVEVYLVSEKAVIQHQPGSLDDAAIRKAVASAGYAVPPSQSQDAPIPTPPDYTRSILSLLGILFGVILFIVVVGEWLGLFERISAQIPWPVSLAIVILIGYPAFLNVIRATRNHQIIAHSLMSLGVLAAIAVGEWATAAAVAFFMRVGDYVEKFTAERARRAVKDLSSLAPQTARLVQDGEEVEVPIEQIQPGEVVVIRPVGNSTTPLVKLVDQLAPQVKCDVPRLLVLRGPVVVVRTMLGGVRSVPVDQRLVCVLLVPRQAHCSQEVPVRLVDHSRGEHSDAIFDEGVCHLV